MSSINLIALSIRTPVNLPLLFRNSPPSIFDDEVILASFNAASLTKYAWPSILLSITGLSGKFLFNSAFVGNDLFTQSFWSQPRPIIKSGFLSESYFLAASITSLKLLVEVKSSWFFK